MTRHSARQKWLGPALWLGAVVVVAGVVAAVLFGVVSESTSLNPATGDPGGHILRTLTRSVSDNLPSRAHVVAHSDREPTWHNCAPGRQSGYSDVEVQLDFRAPAGPAAVVSTAVNTLMVDHGWFVQTSGALWMKSFTESQANGFFSISEEVSLHPALTPPGPQTTWIFHGSSPAIENSHRAFCGGPN